MTAVTDMMVLRCLAEFFSETHRRAGGLAVFAANEVGMRAALELAFEIADLPPPGRVDLAERARGLLRRVEERAERAEKLQAIEYELAIAYALARAHIRRASP